MHAVASPEAAAYEILQQLACTRPSCLCQTSIRKGHGLTHCPVHEDHTPSLNISVIDEVLLVHCQTGSCAQEQVISILRERGVWPQTQPPPTHRTIIATYDYRDIHGNLLYQSVRYSPKGFAQRRPDTRGGWIWHITPTCTKAYCNCRNLQLANIQPVLYRLPELLAADPKRIRIVVEGEKDVETLLRLGFVATCNVGGAGKWQPEYSEWFRNCLVGLVPDNDSSGRNHMVQVARSLHTVAQSVRWIELPQLKKHGDVTDWFDGNGKLQAFKEIVRRAPLYTEGIAETEPSSIQLCDVAVEQYVLTTCVLLPDAIQFLQAEDFTNDQYRAMFQAIRAGEAINVDGLPERPNDFDEWDGICRLRDLTRRRTALSIAQHLLATVPDTGRVFNPCIAADALMALCDHAKDSANTPRLSELLGLM